MKVFCLCFSMMIGMLGIWIEVGTAQTIGETDMPDAKLRTLVLAALKTAGVVDSTATTFTQTDMAHTDFTSLNAPGEGIVDLTGLEYATNLTTLGVANNKITAGISAVEDLTKLTNLDLSKTGISDISAVEDLTSLTTLRLVGNGISDISALKDLTELTYLLSLDKNNISDISYLSKLTKLTSLQLVDNEISNISALKDLTKLTNLGLSANNISDISYLSRLTELRHLHLSDNKISDISVVSGLKKLKSLYLADSKIWTTDPLLPLTELTILDIAGHRITDVGEFQKLLVALTKLSSLRLELDSANWVWPPLSTFDNPEALRAYLYVRPDSIGADRAVSFGDYPEDLPIKTLSVTIRFDEPVYGFQMDDIIVETELDIGTGTATLEALTPTTEPAQTYIATIGLPPNAAGTVTLIVRAGAAETEDRRIDPVVDRVFGPIAFSTLPPPKPPKRKIIFQCPIGWVRSDGFAGRNRRVLLYEVKVEMDLHNRASIYKPVWVAIYVHPDEGLENLDGWKLQVALPHNHHREHLLTAENSVVASEIEGVEGGFAFIENPKETPFPMVGIGFMASLMPGFDYRLYDDRGRKVDFGIACYKRGDIFQVLKDMEDPSVFRKIPLETFNWDADYIRSEWTVPVPTPAAPSLVKKSVVGTWGDLKKQ